MVVDVSKSHHSPIIFYALQQVRLHPSFTYISAKCNHALTSTWNVIWHGTSSGQTFLDLIISFLSHAKHKRWSRPLARVSAPTAHLLSNWSGLEKYQNHFLKDDNTTDCTNHTPEISHVVAIIQDHRRFKKRPWKCIWFRFSASTLEVLCGQKNKTKQNWKDPNLVSTFSLQHGRCSNATSWQM